MDNDQTDKAIKRRLSSIFPDESTKDKIIKMVTEPERPEGWGDQSYAPFYRSYYGEQMQKMVDIQLDTHQDITYDYATYCDVAGGCSPNTLYNRVNQSIRYLLERMDKDGKYKAWREIVRIRRDDEHRCVRVFVIPEISIAMKGGVAAEQLPMPRMSEPVEIIPKWKRDFDAWAENPSRTEPYIKNNLLLSDADQEQFKAEVFGMTHIEFTIDRNSIRAIKVNPV